MASEAEAVTRYAAQQERSVRRAFMEFVQNVKSEEMMAEVRAALASGDINEALDLIDPYVARFGNELTDVFMETAYDEGLRLRNLLGGGYIAVGFDPTYPRAAELMRENRLTFLEDFSTQQKDAIRAVLTEAMDTGLGNIEASRAFRDVIGLTQYQQGMVDSYQDLLERGSSQALDRVLRDRRFDSTVASAIENDEVLTADQIEMMVGRYTDRLLDMRAETIARTETQRILNEARDEATRQIVDQAGFEPGQVIRTWVAVNDARTRDSHAGLDGQERGLDEPFETEDGVEIMYPGDPDAPAEEVINCRCTLAIDFADDVKGDKGSVKTDGGDGGDEE